MRHIIRPIIVLWLALFLHSAHAENWYEGGTLHDATMAEWKQATPENKLATMGDMVSAMYNRDKFVSTVQTAITEGKMPAIKIVAQLLVEQMDEVSNDSTNSMSEQKVSNMVVMLMMLQGVLKS